MSILLSVWPLVVRRSIANWRLLSTILAGVVIAVAILSSLPLYTDAIDEFGLKHVLQNEAKENLNLNIWAPKYEIDYNQFADSSRTIYDKIPPDLSDVIQQTETWITTAKWDADRPPPAPMFQPKGFLSVYSHFADHINVVDGALAQPVPAGLTVEDMKSPDFFIEGMISPETADIFSDIKVGEYLTLSTWNINETIHIRILITGLVEPTDPQDEFWALNSIAFTYPTQDSDGNTQAIAPVFVPEETLFTVVPALLPNEKATYNWYYWVDPDKITPGNSPDIKTAVNQFEYNVGTSLPRSGLITTLNTVIARFVGKRAYSRIPLFLIIFQITAVVFYYLMMVSNMIVDRQGEEISILRSRGANAWTILLMYLFEGIAISVIGAALGLLLGTLFFNIMVNTGLIAQVGEGESISANISGTALTLTLAALLLCIIALLLPAFQASRRGIVHQKQSAARPSGNPFWKRFYLDIVLLIAGGVLYWEAEQSGYFGKITFSGQTMDPLLMVTPLLLIVAFSILFMRLFPLLMKLISKIGSLFANAPVALGLWYMERKPSHYMRPILLLVVASSVGIFAASFIGTLERSLDERNLYTSGGDVRLESLNDTHVSSSSLEERYMSIDGVENVAPAFRITAQHNTTYSQSQVEFLAIDPEKMKEMCWWREDLDDKSLDQLMNIIGEDNAVKDGIPIPEDAETLGVWVYSPKNSLEVHVYARFRDGNGRFQNVLLGDIPADYEGWQFLEMQIKVDGWPDFLPPPDYLTCLYVRTNLSEKADSTYLRVYFDNLQVDSPSYSEPVVLEDFEDVSEWRLSNNLESSSGSDLKDLLGSIITNREHAHDGLRSGEFQWKTQLVNTLGISPLVNTTPLTALASRSFFRSTGLKENAIVNINVRGGSVPVKLVEAVDYFPTLDPFQRGFVIVNISRFFDLQNRQLNVVTTYPDEAWLKLSDDPALRQNLFDTIGQGYMSAHYIYDRVAMTDEMKDDPLVGAAWKGILLIALLGVTFVSGLGFLIYSYLSAQVRKLDFAILRTVGFSLRQITGLVIFEQLLVILAGIGFGIVIGSRLSSIMVPFLQLTGQGDSVLPPFVMSLDWTMIGISYGFMVIAFAATILSVIIYFRRVKIANTLRMGDM